MLTYCLMKSPGALYNCFQGCRGTMTQNRFLHCVCITRMHLRTGSCTTCLLYGTQAKRFIYEQILAWCVGLKPRTIADLLSVSRSTHSCFTASVASQVLTKLQEKAGVFQRGVKALSSFQKNLKCLSCLVACNNSF